MQSGEKISHVEALDLMLADIRSKLTKNGCFSNDSLCSAEIEYVFAVKLKFKSRAVTQLDTTVSGRVGEAAADDPTMGVEATGSAFLKRNRGGRPLGITNRPKASPDGHIA
jgi:hypothetical protein